MRKKNTVVSDDSRFFDPVRGDPPEDCDVLGWSCCYDDDRSSFAASEGNERNPMMMGAGGFYGPSDR